jgi:hypothetical protein
VRNSSEFFYFFFFLVYGDLLANFVRTHAERAKALQAVVVDETKLPQRVQACLNVMVLTNHISAQ